MEYRIVKNEEHNGLEIYFDEKPSEGIRAALKEIKFRWHGVKKCWYGRAELATVEDILGGKVAEVKTARAEILKKCFCKTVDAYLDPDGGYKGSNSHVSAYDVPDKAREIIKACGIKGVTVSKHCASMCVEITVKVRLLDGDVKPFEECREALEDVNANGYLHGGWMVDPDERREVRVSFWNEWDGEKQRRAVALWARNKYDTYVNGYPFSICHGWQLKREEAPMFTEQFFDRWEAMTKIISSFNWNRSNSQADYFDVNFYEEWKILSAA